MYAAVFALELADWSPRRNPSVQRAYTCSMPDKTFLVRLKSLSLAFQQVIAGKSEIQEEHLVFVKSDGKLAALFLMELVQSWNVLEE
jgi:hypothetical protein